MLNDDRLFPGKDVSQVINLEDSTNKWVVDRYPLWERYRFIVQSNMESRRPHMASIQKKNLPMGNDEPDIDDPQITVHTIWVEHEATLVSQHVNNVYQLKDSHKKHWKKFRRIVKTLTMDSNGLPVDFFTPNSNVLSAPPERFTEPDADPITQS
ncbi:hypothetical protein ACEPAI_3994 [Sanghuangporus weigelae]